MAGSREATEARMRGLVQSPSAATAIDGHAVGNKGDGPWDLLQPVGTPMPPKYPVEAAQNGIAGEVILLVDIDADGRVTDVQVEKATPPGVFDANTIAAARQWRFEPALRDGRPVAGRQRVPVTFSLDPPESEARQAQ
ncbi:energy transducer TonB [Pseudoxanthomonas sp. NC8]|nr:energy transducer TonB [Pseudoxanthomonas sp. NC8]